MKSAREFLQTSTGKAIAVVAIIFCVAGAAWSIWSSFSPNDTVAASNNPVFMDAETGKIFHMKLEVGMSIPVISPYTGRATGYIPQACYWTKDGHIKSEPTYVLLNQDLGKTGPTFCPDCGRLVVGRNPPAIEGHKAPPTREEYESHHYP